MIRKTSPFVAIVIATSMLAGCGRAGKPMAPEGSTFPQQYPNPALQSGAVAPASPDRAVFVDPSVDFQNVFSVKTKDYVDPGRPPANSVTPGQSSTNSAQRSTPLSAEPDERPTTFFPIP